MFKKIWRKKYGLAEYKLDCQIYVYIGLIDKQSISALAEQHHLSALNMNMVQGEIPTDPSQLTLSETGGGVMIFDTETPPSQNFMSEVKADVKTRVLSNANEEVYTHTQSFVKQSKFVDITHL